jgi:hypothetical protein
MRTTKRSLEVAARTARRLRDEADSHDPMLGDPAPGRSALERQRNRLAEPTKPFSISAVRDGGARP